MRGLLQSVVRTLNQIDVKGKDNLDMLLGCIQVLEKVLAVSEEKTETTSETTEVTQVDHHDEPRE